MGNIEANIATGISSKQKGNVPSVGIGGAVPPLSVGPDSIVKASTFLLK